MKPLNSQQILDILNQNADRLHQYGVKRIGLFGSFLKEQPKRNSDIDLLVSFDQISFDGYMELKFFLEKMFGRKVDLVIEDDLKPSLAYLKHIAKYAQRV